jgi:DNA-binding CsgD family transcriptional regulator
VTFPLTEAPAIDAGLDADSPPADAAWPDAPAGWSLDPASWSGDLADWPGGRAAPSQAAGRPVFVGRERELGLLDDLLADAVAGRPRIAVVEGEAGLGKTSLIAEFLGRRLDLPALTASGEVSERALPWGLVRQLARRVGADLPGCPLLESGPPASADPLSVGEELLALFAARSTAGLVVVVEDLQWADQPSARALLFACRRLACEKVLVIGSGRPQQLGRLGEGWTRFLMGDRRCGRWVLPRLSAAELSELAGALGRGRPGGLSGRALRRVADHSRGNPLFARAMLTELPDHVLEGPETGLYLPGSLSAAIRHRLGELPAAARNLVVAAAVLGERCALSDAVVLAGVAGSDHALDQAVAAGFLVEQPGQRGVRFAHELIRRAVYASIGAARRRSLHRWAGAMTDGQDSLRHRAASACETDLPLASELDDAAAAAAGRGDGAQAAAYLAQAAELGARGPDRAGRVLRAFEMLVATADAAAAESMRPLVENLPPGPRRDTALGQLAMLRGRPAAAEELFLAAWNAGRAGPAAEGTAGPVIGEAGQASEARQAAGAAAVAAAGLALLYGNALHADECRRWTRRSMRAVTGEADPPGRPASLLAAQAMARALAGDASGALGMFSTLPGPAALVPDAQADALTARGMLRLWTGDLAGADADLTAVATRVTGGLRPRYPGQVLGYLAETAFRLGRWDEAHGHAELAVSMAEDAGRLADLPFAHNLAARVAAFRGQWELASAHVRAAEQAARAAGTQAAAGFAAAARSAFGLARDDPAEVLRAAAPPAWTPGDDPTGSLWRPARIWALIRAGRLDDAATALDGFEAGAAGTGDRQAVVYGIRLRASLALAGNEPERAEAILETGRAFADGLPDPIARTLFDVEYGRCLARAHRRPAALARLRSAHAELTGLGARPFAEAVAAELAALGLRGRPDAGHGLAGLTTQECQVARLVAGGMSNREVAAELYLSPKTIEYHLAHIFAKLGIKTRYQLAIRVGADAAS